MVTLTLRAGVGFLVGEGRRQRTGVREMGTIGEMGET
jgi:hypothetical protein